MDVCQHYECFGEIIGISLRNLALIGVALAAGIAAAVVVWGRWGLR